MENLEVAISGEEFLPVFENKRMDFCSFNLFYVFDFLRLL